MTDHNKNADTRITAKNTNDDVLGEDELNAIAGGLYTSNDFHVHGTYPYQVCYSGSSLERHDADEHHVVCPNVDL